jgi:hypothetical protein
VAGRGGTNLRGKAYNFQFHAERILLMAKEFSPNRFTNRGRIDESFYELSNRPAGVMAARGG